MKAVGRLLLCGAAAALLSAQQFQFNLDHLAAKATETVDVSLDGAMLQFAAKFLDGKDPEETQERGHLGPRRSRPRA